MYVIQDMIHKQWSNNIGFSSLLCVIIQFEFSYGTEMTNRSKKIRGVEKRRALRVSRFSPSQPTFFQGLMRARVHGKTLRGEEEIRKAQSSMTYSIFFFHFDATKTHLCVMCQKKADEYFLLFSCCFVIGSKQAQIMFHKQKPRRT